LSAKLPLLFRRKQDTCSEAAVRAAQNGYQIKCSQLSSRADNFGAGKITCAVQSGADGMAII